MNYSSLNNKYSFSEVNYKIKEKYRTLVWRRYLISGLMIITFAIFTFLITQEFGFIIFGFIMIFFAITYLSIYFYIINIFYFNLFRMFENWPIGKKEPS